MNSFKGESDNFMTADFNIAYSKIIDKNTNILITRGDERGQL